VTDSVPVALDARVMAVRSPRPQGRGRPCRPGLAAPSPPADGRWQRGQLQAHGV